MTVVYIKRADTVRTPNGSIRIIDKTVRELEAPQKGSKITYDDRTKGFGVRVNAAGNRAFILNYYFKGRERRITIGSYPEWSVVAARKQAEDYRRQVFQGTDPLETREQLRSAPTVKDMFQRYCSDHLPKKSARSASDDKSMWVNIILPQLGPKKVEDLRFTDCERLHRKVSLDRPTRANRVIEVLRKALNLAIQWGWITTNPAVGIQKNVENKRSFYLSGDQISDLLCALDVHPQKASAAAIKLMLLTGCRRGEALNARWDQFDGGLRIWTKPAATTKQRLEHRVPVSKAVTGLLSDRIPTSTSPYIFAAQNGAPLTDVKRTWAAVCKTAKLDQLRLHDLRHTFASLLVSQGQSLPVIGAMLGHTQTQTTARYAHLFDDSLANAAELVSLAVSAKP